jgi:hypothetical protein
MQQSETVFPNYAGTPAGLRRVGFRFPDGIPFVTLFTAGDDWDISVFVDADTYRVFIIGTSPDKTKVRILRGLRYHSPKEVDYATAADQAAALNGKTAATATHEELVTEAKAGLTDGDEPQPVQTPPLQLVEATAQPEDKKKGRWDFRFRDQKYNGETRIVAACRLSPPMTMATKSDPAKLVKAFRNGPSQMYFLFDEDTEFLLECIRMHGYKIQRVEVRALKAIHAGETPQQVVEAMAPSLS